MRAETRDHYTEAGWEDGVPGYLWQCFTCGKESDGFETFDDAEQDADKHVAYADTIGRSVS